MSLLAILVLLASGPVWPGAPVEGPYRAGERLAERRDGGDRVGASYRQPAGLWFDGYGKKTSQWVWLITPECASEWLGYAAAREERDPAEALRVWREWTKAREGQMTAVVLLTAFPKLSPLTREERRRADRWGLEELAASLRIDSAPCPLLEARIFERLSGGSADIAKGYPFGEAAGLFFEKPNRAGMNPNVVPAGPYYGAVWVLRFDVRKAPAEWKTAELSFTGRGLRVRTRFENPSGK